MSTLGNANKQPEPSNVTPPPTTTVSPPTPPPQPDVHIDHPPQPAPPTQPTTLKKFRIIVHGEIDVDFDEKTDEDTLAEATIKQIKKQLPEFIITKVLVSESAGPIGDLE